MTCVFGGRFPVSPRYKQGMIRRGAVAVVFKGASTGAFADARCWTWTGRRRNPVGQFLRTAKEMRQYLTELFVDDDRKERKKEDGARKEREAGKQESALDRDHFDEEERRGRLRDYSRLGRSCSRKDCASLRSSPSATEEVRRRSMQLPSSGNENVANKSRDCRSADEF